MRKSLTWAALPLTALLFSASALAAVQDQDPSAWVDNPGENPYMTTVYVGQAINEMIIEVHAPGTAIVGFDHAGQSPNESSDIHNAMISLLNPSALFVPNASAQCRLFSTRIGQAFNPEADPGVGNDRFRLHNAFEAQYMYHCDNLPALTSLDVHWFSQFPDTKQLKLFSDNSQSQKETILTQDQNGYTL